MFGMQNIIFPGSINTGVHSAEKTNSAGVKNKNRAVIPNRPGKKGLMNTDLCYRRQKSKEDIPERM